MNAATGRQVSCGHHPGNLRGRFTRNAVRGIRGLAVSWWPCDKSPGNAETVVTLRPRLRELSLIPALVAFVLLVRALVVLEHPYEINHDSATLLHVAQLLLEGRLPYVDIFETNPPMSWYLHILPVYVARLLDTNVIVVAELGILLLTALVALSIRPLAGRAGESLRRLESGAMALAVALSPWILTGLMFGQREHVFALLIVPWVLVRWVRHQQGAIAPAVAALVGGAAAVAGCMKPPLFLPLLLVPDLYWAATARRIRNIWTAEIVAAVSVTLIFGLHLFVFPAGVWRIFFSRYLPLLAGGYASYNRPFPEVWSAAGQWLTAPALLAVLFLGLPLKRRIVSDSLARPLAWLTLCACVVFLLQRKGFAYHAVPARIWALPLLGLGVARIVDLAGERVGPRLRMPTFARPWAAATGWTLTLALLLYTIGLAATSRADLPAPATDSYSHLLVRFTSPGDNVMILNSSVLPAFPMLVQLKRRAGTRYISTVPLPLLYHFSKPAPGTPLGHRLDPRWQKEEQQFLVDLREDFRKYKPRLVLVNASRTCARCPAGLGIARYLRVKGFLPRELEETYTFLGHTDEYEVYVRRDGA
jgi:hypothetical protein